MNDETKTLILNPTLNTNVVLELQGTCISNPTRCTQTVVSNAAKQLQTSLSLNPKDVKQNNAIFFYKQHTFCLQTIVSNATKQLQTSLSLNKKDVKQNNTLFFSKHHSFCLQTTISTPNIIVSVLEYLRMNENGGMDTKKHHVTSKQQCFTF